MSAVIAVTNNQTNQKRQRTDREIWDQQDLVDNAVHNLIETLVGRKMDWNIHITGDVRDAIIKSLEFHGLVTEDQVYPFVEEDDQEDAEADDDDDDRDEPASLENAIAELRANPVKTACQFGALILVFMTIFIGLPLIADILKR